MNSLAELQAIKEKMKNSVAIRKGKGDIKIVVAMATCGITAGARDTLNAFVEAVNENDLACGVTVTQSGCLGLCEYEPMVEVFEKDKDKVTYINIDADKAKEIVEKHIKGGKVVTEYTVADCK